MKVTARIMLARGLFGGGLLVIAFAIAWWWLSYREVLAYDYLSLSQAGVCLVQDSVVCRLATSLCQSKHPFVLLTYTSTALWAGIAALCAGAATRSSRAV